MPLLCIQVGPNFVTINDMVNCFDLTNLIKNEVDCLVLAVKKSKMSDIGRLIVSPVEFFCKQKSHEITSKIFQCQFSV